MGLPPSRCGLLEHRVCQTKSSTLRWRLIAHEQAVDTVGGQVLLVRLSRDGVSMACGLSFDRRARIFGNRKVARYSVVPMNQGALIGTYAASRL